ncbi:uncharacterized protein LOC129593202 [Paramacrobiotus metropolitanus]|uniref:uncharacterized protein LOC129593202 n=1 Tax=Paramacrobiotus metropolitanus TaxID=2943436 RepID=UPI00244561BD|nr:uncharacterized protein LOC129593202 [Paramacrobiotus metropolitanus]
MCRIMRRRSVLIPCTVLCLLVVFWDISTVTGSDFPACDRVKAAIPECASVVDCALQATTEKSKSKRKAKMGGCMNNRPPECEAVQAKFIQTEDVQGCIESLRS